MEDFNEKSLNFSTPASLKRRIKAAKTTVKDKYTVYMGTAKKLVAAYNALLDAEEKNEYSNSSKNTAKCAVADNRFKAAAREYLTYASLYESFVDDVIALYDELILNDRPSAARRTRVACEKFEIQQKLLQERIADVVKSVEGIPDSIEDIRPTRVKEDVEEKPKAKPEPQTYIPPQEPAYRPYYMPPQGVTIAPMSIDISKTVEDAISASLEKFKEAFAKRIDGCVNELPVMASSEENISAESDGVYEMEVSVLNEEKLIVEKLLKLTEDLKTLSDAVSQLGATYMELADKQKNATELQRTINDMQRSVSREIQGVQVNQKVIAQDQAAVSGEQAALIEQQKANVENQKLALEAQEGVSEMQKTVIMAHTALEEQMSEILSAQKDAIATQQAIVTASVKNIELQRDVLEKQTELTEEQKAVMTAQRALSRSQRSLSAKMPTRVKQKAEETAIKKGENITPADASLKDAATAEVEKEI